MTSPDPVLATIAAHRAAYDAFQTAPEGEASEDAEAAYFEASDSLMAQACTTAAGGVALLKHLRWWIADEAEFAEAHGLAYQAAKVRVADLTVLACTCWPASAVGPDPIHRAIAAAESAEQSHTAVLAALDESDDAQVRRANAAADTSTAAFKAVTTVMPTSRAGLLALADFYAREAEEVEPSCLAGRYLRHFATILDELRLAAEERGEAA